MPRRTLRILLASNDKPKAAAPATTASLEPTSVLSVLEGYGRSNPTPRSGTPSTGLATLLMDTDCSEDAADKVVSTICAQLRIDETHLSPSTRFEEIGLDSLSTIEVVGIVCENPGLDLPTSFFAQNPTVAAVKRALASPPPGSSGSSTSSQVVMPEANSSDATSADTSTDITPIEHNLDSSSAKVVLLQGSTHSNGTPLFFFPDGSGSPAVLLQFPSLVPGGKGQPRLHLPVAAARADTTRRGGLHDRGPCKSLRRRPVGKNVKI